MTFFYAWNINTLMPDQNGGHFADDIFIYKFWSTVVIFWIKITDFISYGSN